MPNGEHQIICPDQSQIFDRGINFLSLRHQCENPYWFRSCPNQLYFAREVLGNEWNCDQLDVQPLGPLVPLSEPEPVAGADVEPERVPGRAGPHARRCQSVRAPPRHGGLLRPGAPRVVPGCAGGSGVTTWPNSVLFAEWTRCLLACCRVLCSTVVPLLA